MEFHRELVVASRNALLQAMASVVLEEAIESLEEILDVITGGHGTHEQSLPEHEEILAAIRARDPDAAEESMVRHLNRLISEVETFLENGQGQVVDRLLQLRR
jgi:DNA-binding GntR family transcriptional regulator